MTSPAAARRPGIDIDPNDAFLRVFRAGAHLMARYHRHRVLHLERIGRLLGRGRRVVLVGNHVLDVLDPLLFTIALYDRYGSVPHFVGHENLIFRFPALGRIASRAGMIPARHQRAAAAALRHGGLLMIYPGSGSEAARRVYRDEPYRLKWEKRFGFLRLALQNDAEIVFVAGVGIDEMYYQSAVEIPTWFLRLWSSERYRGARFQFGLLGLHLLPGFFPLPVRVTHVVSPPLDLGDRAAARRDRRALRQLHERVWGECQEFLDGAVAARERNAPLVDRALRGAERLLERLGV